MSGSLLTNKASMTALLTLQKLSGDMLNVQKQISTGLKVNEAADNIAYWGMSNAMRNDSSQLSAVRDSLNNGRAQINQANAASKHIRDELKKLQDDTASAMSAVGQDGKLQAIQISIKSSLDAIKNALNNAAIDGQNFLVSNIEPDKFSMSAPLSAASIAAIKDAKEKENAQKYKEEYDAKLTAWKKDHPTFDVAEPPAVAKPGTDADDATKKRYSDYLTAHANWEKSKADFEAKHHVAPKQTDFEIVASFHRNGDAVVVDKIKLSKNDLQLAGVTGADHKLDTSQGLLKDLFNNKSNPFYSEKDDNTDFKASTITNQALMDFNITLTKCSKALDNVDAILGSAGKEVDNQISFINNLTTNLDKSVGALVDADMDAESAKLSALQVQQQLAVQALSIANQSTQHILSLYRQ